MSILQLRKSSQEEPLTCSRSCSPGWTKSKVTVCCSGPSPQQATPASTLGGPRSTRSPLPPPGVAPLRSSGHWIQKKDGSGSVWSGKETIQRNTKTLWKADGLTHGCVGRGMRQRREWGGGWGQTGGLSDTDQSWLNPTAQWHGPQFLPWCSGSSGTCYLILKGVLAIDPWLPTVGTSWETIFSPIPCEGMCVFK